MVIVFIIGFFVGAVCGALSMGLVAGRYTEDKLGDEYGVTKERIRQVIEKKSKESEDKE